MNKVPVAALLLALFFFDAPLLEGVLKGEGEERFLAILVDAPHLDCRNSQTFFQTLTKHPDDGSKQGRVGHAWIYLHGEGQVIEGGHSGERGVERPKYAEGMLALAYEGDSNPARYLFKPLDDGFFQRGSGGHTPTFAAKFPLTKEQYRDIVTFIDPRRYPYKNYSLTGRQCVTLVQQVAALLEIALDCDQTIKILPKAKVRGKHLPLWSDPRYSEITFASPDRLEQRLIELVEAGRAEPALHWYRKMRGKRRDRESLIDTLRLFPYRYKRHLGTF